ncbi:MAG: CGNR zinc finger domain-containing protein [Sphingomonas sp.]|nr:CGNR zinc finger domain-containing protein [Sphingomonas sp.]
MDFVNTRDERPAGGIERLVSYLRLLDFLRQSGALEAEAFSRLGSLATEQPEEAGNVLASAISLREAMFTVLQSSCAARRPAQRPLSVLNRWIPSETKFLTGRKGGLSWSSVAPGNTLCSVLRPLVASLADLLTTDAKRQRVKLCSSATCDWYFLDRSPRANRRWCDMTVCGNRAKARRHYARIRSSLGASTGQELAGG